MLLPRLPTVADLVNDGQSRDCASDILSDIQQSRTEDSVLIKDGRVQSKARPQSKPPTQLCKAGHNMLGNQEA
jgi:hypothetical protein